MRKSIATLISVLFVSAAANAQSFEASGHFASAKWSEFEGNDLGFGGRVSWLPMPLVGVDADLTFYPADFPENISFSRYRFEGLFGATIGPRFNRVRPFVKAAGGFLKVGPTPGAFACIAIYPPPLACALAGGDTLPAFDIGGGVSIDASSRTFIRVDVGDRIVKYPGPTFRGGLQDLEPDGFAGHAVRFTLGGGVRF